MDLLESSPTTNNAYTQRIAKNNLQSSNYATLQQAIKSSTNLLFKVDQSQIFKSQV